jgi:HAD superfamily hydrolase (TIGR01509 family)
MTQYKGVILDVDGTLVDSNDAHAHAWVETLAEAGFPVDFARVRRLIGMGGDRLVEELTGLPRDGEQNQALGVQRSAVFCARWLRNVTALPGSRALVERLRGDGFAVAVASAAKSEELEPLLRLAGVADLVPARTSSSDVDESKPDPEIIQAALQRLGVPARAAVMIGDTPYDVEAATGAHVATIGFTSGGWSHELVKAGAIAIYEHAADLLARFDGSPLAR